MDDTCYFKAFWQLKKGEFLFFSKIKKIKATDEMVTYAQDYDLDMNSFHFLIEFFNGKKSLNL